MITTKIKKNSLKKYFLIEKLKEIMKSGECFMQDFKIDTKKVEELFGLIENDELTKTENSADKIELKNNETLQNQTETSKSNILSQQQNLIIDKQLLNQIELDKRLENLLNLK